MSNKITILLIENNAAERENFLALAQPENWVVLAMASSYEAIQWLKKNDEAAVAIIAEESTPLNAYQAFDYIRREIKSNMPVVITVYDKPSQNVDNHLYIKKPFSANSIKIIQEFMIPGMDKPAQKVYSLDYLETISGGNQEFLVDCLRTFISSVSDKMNELKVAVGSNDNTAIGAIAHNIKPSFEMLENDKARDICNKLTYEAETSDIPSLALQLDKEFKTMETALKQDFPDLR